VTTLVCFHAHPDDETTATAGVMAKAAAAGLRTVLVVGTNGEQGEPVPGVLDEGEPLWQRRIQEAHRSAAVLGVARVEFLGYEDSGMMGEPTNDNPACFWQADVDEAADRLAAILRTEDDVVLTIYDDHGGYGHPDHIQVHRVGVKAAERAGITRVFQSTMNREALARQLVDRPAEAAEVMSDEDVASLLKEIDEGRFGSPESVITHAVDVRDFLDQKRRSMAAHESQIAPDSFFLAMPDEPFALTWGTEWFIEHGATRPEGAPFGSDILTPATTREPARPHQPDLEGG
jgi:LmbE family N-acetylglucosaminyl deacetylase